MVEVIVAFGLLAGLLISIAGLFVLGTRQVHSGRESTEALAMATSVVEETGGWGFHQVYDLFGISPERTSALVDTRTNPRASLWQPGIETRLSAGYALIRIESLGQGPPTFADTRAIRLTVEVHWQEGLRARSLRLATVRF